MAVRIFPRATILPGQINEGMEWIYLINYLGIGGIEECGTHRGSLESLAEHITMIEGQGGHSLTVTDDIHRVRGV